MSSLFRDYGASLRPRGEPFRSWFDKLATLSKIEGRSMVLCLAGHYPILSMGANARR
jgi:hypothetical protein